MNDSPTFYFALRDDVKDDRRFLPTRAEPLSTGYDVRACQKDRKDIIVKPGEYIKIPLGFRAFCPPGWWYRLAPRSSSFVKKHLQTLYGTIDESFESEAMFCAKYDPDVRMLNPELRIVFGEALGQIIPVRRVDMQVMEITNEDYDKACKARGGVRGTGGFGSTSEKTSSVGFYKTGGNE